jgi:glutamate synthase (NADPH/NADH) large chain
MENRLPTAQGLYDPQYEKDACGVGFVCNIKGNRSHDIVKSGLKILERLTHRGATGADPKTGDGAGILIQVPHEFCCKIAGVAGFALPDRGSYGTGIIFLPTDKKEYQIVKDIFKQVIASEGQTLLGWRAVLVDNTDIGKAVRETEPTIEQIFIGSALSQNKDPLSFERKLYIIRKKN